ncbi:MAG: hypothetical protein WDN45_02160 [Caulobacteraceae bacterium]
MKQTLMTLVAVASLAGAAAPAFAQGPRPSDWQPLSARQVELDHRIDDGVRKGQLTRSEARSLRDQFNNLLRLEARYQRGGINYNERTDLQRRYDMLESRVRFEKRDDETRYHPAGRR